jgi:hypothetical protein
VNERLPAESWRDALVYIFRLQLVAH